MRLIILCKIVERVAIGELILSFIYYKDNNFSRKKIVNIHTNFNYPTLKLHHFLSVTIVILILSFAACSSYDEYSKNEFLFSNSIGNQLYTASYRVASYGVGGDVYSVYVTDILYTG